jgi:hypothetical protein
MSRRRCLGGNHLDAGTSQVQAAFDDAFDQVMLFHGSPTARGIMRSSSTRQPILAPASRPEHLRYRFKHCVRATVWSALSQQIWKQSLDERLVD